MRIVVLDGKPMNPGDLDWGPLEALGEVVKHERTPPEQVVERLAGAEVAVTNKVVIDEAVLSEAPTLKLIAVTATGINIVDAKAARQRGIPVVNVPAYSTASVAQLVFAYLLELANRVGDHSRAVLADNAWCDSPDFSFTVSPQIELAGKTIGILGFGDIGRSVGAIAHAFGMKVLAQSRSRSQAAPYPFAWASVEELAAQSDILTLHCPLTPENERLVDAGFLSRMKRGAWLVNTARGGLVDEAALAASLRDGHLGAAALDVAVREPLNADSPLLGAPNLLLTPHIAWATREARSRLLRATANNIEAWRDGHPVNVVN